MAQTNPSIDVYLEISPNRTFAVALDWPGWCRSGRGNASERNEVAALQALLDYGPRYARVIGTTSLEFQPPSDLSAFNVVDRLEGTGTTSFGAPDRSLPGDPRPVDPAELARWQVILTACWQAFDAAVQAAQGKTLSKGPRGGGRELDKIVEHVRDVDAAYLSSLGGKVEKSRGEPLTLALVREAILTTLAESVRGAVPERSPRGKLRWTPRYFVRRLAWHELDHVWEIEDRVDE